MKSTRIKAYLLLIIAGICVAGQPGCAQVRSETPKQSLKENHSLKRLGLKQIRGGHIGRNANHDVVKKMAANDMNSIFVPIKSPDPASQLQVLNQWYKCTKAAGINFFPLISCYRTSDRKYWPLTETYVNRAGRKFPHTPCPTDDAFWQGKITDVCVRIAKWAADKPTVSGILVDTEMYGADRSAYPDVCFCPQCRRRIANELGISVDAMNFDDEKMLARYRKASAKLTERIFAETLRQVRSIIPDMMLGGYNFDHDGPFYEGWCRAWGTPSQPVLVLTERTYEKGVEPMLADTQKRLANWGVHASLVGGLWIQRVPDENVAEQLYHLATRGGGGYWLYEMIALSDRPTHLLPGGGAPVYWKAIRQANGELDKWLAADGAYESSLQIRPFTLPAPGISIDRWKPFKMPAGSAAPATRADFMVRGSETMTYLHANAGEKVTLTINVDVVSKKKQDAIGMVLMDPAGRIIKQGTFAIGGDHLIEFKAETVGSYCLFLRGVRYACRISQSSHQWATMLPPGRISLMYPRKIFLPIRPGSREARINLSVEGPGEAIIASVFADGDKPVATKQISTKAGQTLTVPLKNVRSKVLRVEFASAPAGKLEDVSLSVAGGVLPWLIPDADGPFPKQ